MYAGHVWKPVFNTWTAWKVLHLHDNLYTGMFSDNKPYKYRLCMTYDLAPNGTVFNGPRQMRVWKWISSIHPILYFRMVNDLTFIIRTATEDDKFCVTARTLAGTDDRVYSWPLEFGRLAGLQQDIKGLHIKQVIKEFYTTPAMRHMCVSVNSTINLVLEGEETPVEDSRVLHEAVEAVQAPKRRPSIHASAVQ